MVPAGNATTTAGIAYPGLLPVGAGASCPAYAYRTSSSQASAAAAPLQLAGDALPAGASVLLASPGYFEFQACSCRQLPGGVPAAEHAPVLGWGTTAGSGGSSSVEATCLAVGEDMDVPASSQVCGLAWRSGPMPAMCGVAVSGNGGCGWGWGVNSSPN